MNRWLKPLLITGTCVALAMTYQLTRPGDATDGPRAVRGPAGKPIPKKEQVLADFADSLKDIRMVETEVRDRNLPNLEQRRKFSEEGWKFVTTPPPDKDVLALDPALLGAREDELQLQIHSTSWTGDALDQLYEIASKTELDRTRYVALEALGRSGEERAQQRLMEFYANTQRAEDQSLILGYLRPQSIDDPVGRFLIDRVNDSGSTPETRRQAAFPLVIAAAIAGPEESENLLASVRSERRAELASMTQLITEGARVAEHTRKEGE